MQANTSQRAGLKYLIIRIIIIIKNANNNKNDRRLKKRNKGNGVQAARHTKREFIFSPTRLNLTVKIKKMYDNHGWEAATQSQNTSKKNKKSKTWFPTPPRDVHVLLRCVGCPRSKISPQSEYLSMTGSGQAGKFAWCEHEHGNEKEKKDLGSLGKFGAGGRVVFAIPRLQHWRIIYE